MSLTIRALTLTDLDVVDDILMLAYNTPRAHSRKHDLMRYLQLQPDGWLLALLNGVPAGIAGAIDYGTFSYIGLVGVHPAMQRKGIASGLMRQLLDWLDTRGNPNILLDASPAGAPLYERLGFQDIGKALQFQRDSCDLWPQLSDNVRPLQASEIEELAAFDAPIFGANRAAVLAAYLADFPGRAFIARNAAGQISGYVFGQSQTIGPWAARDMPSATGLLGAVLPLRFDVAPRVIVSSANTNASGLLLRYGFSPTRSLRHMGRSSVKRRSQALQLYGQASFAIG